MTLSEEWSQRRYLTDAHVLAISPDFTRTGGLVGALQQEGVHAVGVTTPGEALYRLHFDRPAVVLLDLEIPDGRVLLTRARRDRRVVVVLSDDPAEQEAAREAGVAEVYDPDTPALTIAAEVLKLLRRSFAHRQRLRVGPLEVNLRVETVRWEGKRIHVTPLQFDICAYLAARPGCHVRTEVLLAEVWGETWRGAEGKVYAAICRLREILGKEFLHHEGRLGYGFFALGDGAASSRGG